MLKFNDNVTHSSHCGLKCYLFTIQELRKVAVVAMWPFTAWWNSVRIYCSGLATKSDEQMASVQA